MVRAADAGARPLLRVMVLGEYAAALAVTLAVEVVVAALAAGRVPRMEAVATCALLNLVTHPLATLAVHAGGAPEIATEVAVALIETVGYVAVLRLRWAHAAALAVAANGASCALGLAIDWG